MINAQTLKEKLIDEPEKIELILNSLNCEYIRDRGSYYTSTRPDGDNKTSIVVYKDTMVSNCYTLGIEGVDIIELVQKLKDLYFTHAINWICNICEWDYYERAEENDDDVLFAWLDKVEKLNSRLEDEIIITPYSEDILTEYFPYPNIWLKNEGVSTEIQEKWEIHYDVISDSIVYPVRDELGTLIGVKARCLSNPEHKFIALYPYPKTEILYGLFQNYNNIKQQNEVIVVEAEKGCLILESMGFTNVVALSGKTPSKTQVDKLLNLNVPIVWALDKDVWIKDKEKDKDKGRTFKEIIKNIKLFTKQYMVYDKSNLLDKNDSPYDKGIDVWLHLYNNKIPIK